MSRICLAERSESIVQTMQLSPCPSLRTTNLSLFAVLLISFLTACSSQKEAKPPSASLVGSLDESSAAPPVENVQSPVTQLERADVVRTVDEGLGRFLGNFSTEPAFDQNEQFQGFRIVKVRNRDLFRGLGIGRGDVVTRINDLPIESPPQAYAAFVSLKTAPSLDIDYLRGGRKMRLSLPIVGEAPPESSEKAQKTGEKKADSPASSEGKGAAETSTSADATKK